MLIYRFEHKRSVCDDLRYAVGGESVTGHGTAGRGDCIPKQRPNFGGIGHAPNVIMAHERCGVTASQFASWIGYDNNCRYTHSRCEGNYLCVYCPETRELNVPDEWELVIYRVKDARKGSDWRIDNNQIVFDPETAQRVGVADRDKIRKLAKEKVYA